MVSPIHSSQPVHQAEVSQPAKPPAQKDAAKPQPARAQDSVSLKSTGDLDHDGDSK